MPDEDARSGRFAHLKRTPAEELAERLQRGEFISARDIGGLLRADPPNGWPVELIDHAAGLLDGTIRQGRGRRPEGGKTIIDAHMSLVYSALMRWLNGDRDLPEEVGAFVEEHMSEFDERRARHEIAAGLTSVWFYGHKGHAKKIANRISSRKTAI